MSLLTKLFGGSYEDLWKAVIRPNRDQYTDVDLGPEKFEIKGKFYKRTDFTLTNQRGYKLQCSFWEPYDEEREYERLPCVVYLHGNSSSRCEAVGEVKYLLPMNITVFAFDFTACGKSEGEYISLGWYERDDVECVIEFLRKCNKVSTIGLWGRSMGAVTAIMYGDRDPSIAGLVLDSAFASLKVLIEELVKDRVNLPNFILNQATKLVKSTVNKKAKFNLDDIEPIKYAERCFIPALFCHGNNDSFVRKHHCEELYNVYPGDKNVIYENGDHNSARSRFFRDSASIFFHNTLRCDFIKEISDNYAGFKFNISNRDEGNNNNEGQGRENDNQDNINNEDLNEEEQFLKILEISKKEYIENEAKKNSNKDNHGQNNNNNQNNNQGNNNNVGAVVVDNIITDNFNPGSHSQNNENIINFVNSKSNFKEMHQGNFNQNIEVEINNNSGNKESKGNNKEPGKSDDSKIKPVETDLLIFPPPDDLTKLKEINLVSHNNYKALISNNKDNSNHNIKEEDKKDKGFYKTEIKPNNNKDNDNNIIIVDDKKAKSVKNHKA